MAKKKQSDSFDKIIDDLDSAEKRRYYDRQVLSKSQLFSKRWLLLGLVMLLGIGIVVVGRVNWSQLPSTFQSAILKDGTYGDNFPFDSASLGKIRQKMKSAKGYSLDDFVRDYGQPSEVQSLMIGQEYPGKDLTYNRKKLPIAILSAHFADEDGKGQRLYLLSFADIKDPVASRVTSTARTLTADEVSNLKVGTGSGVLGISYDEVVKAYGLPISVNTVGSIDVKNDKESYIAVCVYPYVDGKRVRLEFRKSYSGQYHLKGKTTY